MISRISNKLSKSRFTSIKWISRSISVSTTGDLPNLINGEFVSSKATEWIDVTNPATQEVISRVPCTTADELKAAEEGAKEAFQTWKEVPVQQRQRVMFKYQQLIRDHTEALAHTRPTTVDHYDRALYRFFLTHARAGSKAGTHR